MKWLEPPHDEGERLLREGLDEAARRTGDQITHRRLWARISEAMVKPQPRIAGRLVLASAAIVLFAVGGVLGLPRLLDFFGPQPASVSAGGPAAGAPVASGSPTGPAGTLPTAATSPPVVVESEHLPGQFVRTHSGEHARVALGGGAEAELAENSSITWDSQQRPSVEHGAATLTVPHQPPGWRFSVTAGPYIVTVVGTKFEVRVDHHTVGVAVSEGVVEVWHGSRSTRLLAGESWNGPFEPEEAEVEAASVAPAEKPHVRARLALHHPIRGAAMVSRALQQAQAALQAGDTSKAIEMLGHIASGTGPAAENAAYELGRITRYHLNRPRQAVALWDRYRVRFPGGLLRAEADLSILDTLTSLGDVHAALGEAEAFLARHPSSERRVEVQKLAERLRAVESASSSR
jgi:hypothetical protein